MKTLFNFIKSLFNGTALKEAIDSGAVNLGGQGKNKYGR